MHEHIERLIKIGFDSILNIGCADGYYAIGIAKRIPGARIFAHDINEKAQASCRAFAEINNVSDRVEIGGLFKGVDYDRFSDSKTWLLMDIEGDERELLDPCSYPILRKMTILVECHDCFVPGLANEIASRFAHSHSVVRVDHSLAAPKLPVWLQGLGHLDQLLATWEWRIGPTPWLVMEPR